MEIKLCAVQPNEWETIRNLWEKYDYETSLYDMDDVDDLGLYNSEDFNFYLIKDVKWAYFITVDNKIAGFVIITDFSVIDKIEVDYQISEFFIMKKYCRLGVGKHVFKDILRQYKGRFQIVCNPQNTIAVQFWTKVVNEYTNGNYKIISSAPDFMYPSGVSGNVFVFEN